MEHSHSITTWIAQAKTGHPEAVEAIWNRFIYRVEGLAKAKLRSVPSRFGDQSDLAQEVFAAVFEGISRQSFQQMMNRDDLWQVLAMVTARRAANMWRKNQSTLEDGESVLNSAHDEDCQRGLEAIAGSTDELIADSLDSAGLELLQTLEPKLQQVALLRFRGYSNVEIAERIGRSVKSVERYFEMIRQTWQNQGIAS